MTLNSTLADANLFRTRLSISVDSENRTDLKSDNVWIDQAKNATNSSVNYTISLKRNKSFCEEPAKLHLTFDHATSSRAYSIGSQTLPFNLTTEEFYINIRNIAYAGGMLMNLGQLCFILSWKLDFFVGFSYIRQILFVMMLSFIEHNCLSRYLATGLHWSYTYYPLFESYAGILGGSVDANCSLPTALHSKIGFKCQYRANRASLWLIVFLLVLLVKIIVGTVSCIKRRSRNKKAYVAISKEIPTSNLSAMEKIDLVLHHKVLYYIIECAFTEWLLPILLFSRLGITNSGLDLVMILLAGLFVSINILIVLFITFYIFLIIKCENKCGNLVSKFAANFAFVFNLKKEFNWKNKVYPICLKLTQLVPILVFVYSGNDSLAQNGEFNRKHGIAAILFALFFFLCVNHLEPLTQNNGFLVFISACTLACSLVFVINFMSDLDRWVIYFANFVAGGLILLIGVAWAYLGLESYYEILKAWRLRSKSQSIKKGGL